VRPWHTTGGINLVLSGGGSIAGRITIKGTRSPARGVCVVAVSAKQQDGGSAVTGQSGYYRISALNTGLYHISVQTSEGCEQGTENLAPAGLRTTVRVTAGHVTSGINASVGLGGSISGKVSAAGGGPVPGACIEAFPLQRGQAVYGTTSRYGTYLLNGLAPGRYKVRLGNPSCSHGPVGLAELWFDGAGSSATATAVSVRAGHTRTGVSVALPLDGTITGTVTGPGSKPLTGICVSAVPVARYASTVYAVTSKGSYELPDLPLGRYRVEFQSGCGATGWATQWWDGARSSATAKAIKVRSDTVINGVNAVMAAASG